MKKWLLSLLLVAATYTCSQAQVQLPQVYGHLKTPTYRGQIVKTDEYKLILSELPKDDEVVRYRFISGSRKRRQTNDWVVIPQKNTGLSDSPIDGRYYANVWFFHSKTNRGRIEFDVANIVPEIPEVPIPPATTTNWSTTTLVASVSPLDPNQVVIVKPGQKKCLFAAVRISGKGIFKVARWLQGGISGEAPPRNMVVMVVDSTGQSITLPTTSPDGWFFFTAVTSGIPFDGYIDVVLKGDIPENVTEGRYVLPILKKETDIAVEDATGLRLHVVPDHTEEVNYEKSEFPTLGFPSFYSGSPSVVVTTP